MIRIPCAYCGIVLHIVHGDLEILKGKRSARVGGPMRCDGCGSTTQIEISTKRVRKGKAHKAREAAAEAARRANVEAQRTENARIGAELLAEPGCTCASIIGRQRVGEGDAQDSGHPLSTGWSQDRSRGGMMPTVPRHRHGCPRYRREKDIPL